MTIERNNIRHTMWRKKVDNSIFSSGHIVIPKAYVKQWRLEFLFRDNGKNAETWPIEVQFGTKIYNGKVFYRPPTKARSSVQHKILIKEDLIEDLKKAFLMSHIRWLEVELRKQGGKKLIPIASDIIAYFGYTQSLDGSDVHYAFTYHPDDVLDQLESGITDLRKIISTLR